MSQLSPQHKLWFITLTLACLIELLILHSTNALPAVSDVTTAEATQESATAQPTITPLAVTIQSTQPIPALFYPAPNPPAPALVLLNFKEGWSRWAVQWNARGYNVLAIDLHAYNQVMSPQVAHDDIQDILLSARQLNDNPAVIPHQIAIIGDSLMGGYAMVACAKSPDCQAAVLLSPTDFKDDLTDPVQTLGKRPLLIIASKVEGTITATAQDYAQRALGDHQLILYEGTTHARALISAHPELADIIGDWLVKEFPLEPTTEPTAKPVSISATDEATP